MKLLLIDKNTLFLEGLQNLLISYGMEIAGTASHVSEIIGNTGIPEPDVIMINISGDNSREIMRAVYEVGKEIPSAHIIAFADCRATLSEAMQNGISCYLLSDIRGEELHRKLLSLKMEAVPDTGAAAGIVRP